MTERAQSEALGFVLVFAVVLTAVALVTATGFSGLQGAQAAKRHTNAEQGFSVFADNVDDLVTGAPSRSTELSLAGARLSLADPVTVRVNGTRLDGPGNFSYAFDVRPVVYDDDSDTTLAFTAGAVVRSDRYGAVALREPGWRLGGERTVLPLVQTRARGEPSVGGTASVLIATQHAETTLLHSSAAPHEVTVAVVSPRADAWERLLEAQTGADCARSGDAVSCTYETDRVRLSVVRVDVSFR